MKTIQVYGATWCADCKRSRKYLDDHRVEYEYIDIDTVPGAVDEVVKLNDGLRRIPTIVFPDGIVLVEPSNILLEETISGNSVLL